MDVQTEFNSDNAQQAFINNFVSMVSKQGKGQFLAGLAIGIFDEGDGSASVLCNALPKGLSPNSRKVLANLLMHRLQFLIDEWLRSEGDANGQATKTRPSDN